MSEDREDGRQQVEEDTPPLLKRVLFGSIMGIFVMLIEFGGLFGISPSSIWQGLLGILAAGCAFGSILGVASSWLAPEDRFKWFCVCCIAGGAAGTAAWLIVQPDTSIVVVVGANALLATFYYLADYLFS